MVFVQLYILRRVTMELICKNCKYKQDIGNTTETGAAICTNATSYLPINITDKCHLIPEKKELKCSDCKTRISAASVVLLKTVHTQMVRCA